MVSHRANTDRRARRTRMAFLLGILLAFAVAAPGLTQDVTPQPQDPGGELAAAAGCDLSRDDVPMDVAVLDYTAVPGSPLGAPTVEEAVMSLSKGLAEDGAAYSEADLRAAAAAVVDGDRIEASLPGLVVYIQRWSDGSYLVTGWVRCV